MYKLIVSSIVLGFILPCSSMDSSCHATKENIINFYGTSALIVAKKNKSKKYVLSTKRGKAHYQLLDPVVCYPQTPGTLSLFKNYLDQYNLPVDCPVKDTTSLLDLYISNSIATGDFLPLHQYLQLGADPEYTLTKITPIQLAEGLMSVNEMRASFTMFLLQCYIEKKYQTKK